jgi:hypothetical protein
MPSPALTANDNATINLVFVINPGLQLSEHTLLENLNEPCRSGGIHRADEALSLESEE